MVRKEIVVACAAGLHNQQATYFVKKANEFSCTIQLESGSRTMNGKSLLGILSLGITAGTKVVLSADGKDAEEAVAVLEEVLLRSV